MFHVYNTAAVFFSFFFSFFSSLIRLLVYVCACYPYVLVYKHLSVVQGVPRTSDFRSSRSMFLRSKQNDFFARAGRQMFFVYITTGRERTLDDIDLFDEYLSSNQLLKTITSPM